MTARVALRASAVVALCCLWACGPQVKDGAVALKLLRGDTDPLDDPGSAQSSSSPVGSLALRYQTEAEAVDVTLDLSSGEAPTFRVAVAPSKRAQLYVEGRRAADGAPYSGGRSLSFSPEAAPTVPVFLGPIEAFTLSGEALTAPRLNAASASVASGALLVGGVDAIGAPVEPYLLRYRLDAAGPCAGPDCLTGEQPLARAGAIAVSLDDGSVVHGLGKLANGTFDASLYRTNSDGTTERLGLSGEALPARAHVAASLGSDGRLYLFGGVGATTSNAVLAVDLTAMSVTALAQPMLAPRSRAAAVRLESGAFLVAGGSDDGGPLDSAELYTPGQGSALVDGGAFGQARKTMRAPRVAPAAVRLKDDAVLVCGGGAASCDVFRLDWGRLVGGFVDLVAPAAPLTLGEAMLARLPNGEILMVGGERSDAPKGFAAVFTAEPSQVLSAAQPTYRGTYRTAGAAHSLRHQGCLTAMPDGSALLWGGSRRGVPVSAAVLPDPAPRAEVLVPKPL